MDDDNIEEHQAIFQRKATFFIPYQIIYNSKHSAHLKYSTSYSA